MFNDLGRFRRLKYLDMKKIELIPQTIIACCVLHNIYLKFDDNQWMDTLISEQQPNLGDDITVEQLTCYTENTQSGCMKRDQIMVSLTKYTYLFVFICCFSFYLLYFTFGNYGYPGNYFIIKFRLG